MKHQIKNITGRVLYECEVPPNVSQIQHTRYALETAVLEGANLEEANLAWANLAGANLAGASLAGASLAWANLAGANLAGASLAWANLAGAILAGANLAGANLAGASLAWASLAWAYLEGANLEGERTLIGKRPHFSIGPIGSRSDSLSLWITDKGLYVTTGCFAGSLHDFAAAVEKKHGDTDHGKEYQMAILMIEAHATLWTPGDVA